MAQTPRPWHVSGMSINGPDGSLVAVPVAPGNAELIVEAVNAYDDLKAKAALVPEVAEALKLAIGIASANPDTAGIVTYCGEILAQAKAIMPKHDHLPGIVRDTCPACNDAGHKNPDTTQGR